MRLEGQITPDVHMVVNADGMFPLAIATIYGYKDIAQQLA